jgi:hypothetical protein
MLGFARFLTRWLRAVVVIALVASAVVSQARADDVGNKGRWMVGLYAGSLAHQAFINVVLLQPWQTRLEPSYLAALSLTYVVHEFRNLPLTLEIDGVVAVRFGQDHEWELAVLPMLRWKAFPWNHLVYTNFRFGLGVSYVSDVSPWEKQNSGNGRGSRLLPFMVPEITFSSGPDSMGEAFLRVHHRSGGWGIINGVSGGSNYVSVGYRSRF